MVRSILSLSLSQLALYSSISMSALASCTAEEDDPVEHVTLANTLPPPHADVLVTSGYRGGWSEAVRDYFHAALEVLPEDRFAVAWIEGSTGTNQLFCKRYDVSDGGFLSPLIYLDSSVRNVRRAGYAYDPEIGQGVAWLTWDYHPNPSTYSVNWARIHNDGTFERVLDVATGAAGAAGAMGNTRTVPPKGQPRILITYVSDSLHTWETGFGRLPCGLKLNALLYDQYGDLLAGPITVDTVSYPYCLSGPSVAFNTYATRFEILYQYRNRESSPEMVNWRAMYVTPSGVPEVTPHYIGSPTCGVAGLKSGIDTGIQSGGECHRHTLAYDSSERNGTHRFALANYGHLFFMSQTWSINLDNADSSGWRNIVDRALVNTNNCSYQTFTHESGGEFRNPKFLDTSSAPQDADPIGTRACSDGASSRGSCYYNEAMATVGYYTAVLYADQSADPPWPLFLSILDAS